MNMDEILEAMDELLDKAPSVPFASHKSVVDSDRLRELINDARLNMPQEIKNAKLISFDCNRIIKEAEAKAEKIIRKAEERAKMIVSNDAIVKEARERAVDLITKAQSNAKEIRNATDVYISNVFTDIENALHNSLKNIKSTKTRLEQVKIKKE